MRRPLAIAFLILIAAPRVAHAAWYYTWHCTGRCAPGQLAIHGYEGPFGSYDACEGVRANDARRDEFLAEGNLGGTTTCEQSDAPPAVDGAGGRPLSLAPLARFTVTGIAGPGYRVQDANGLEPSTGSTAGVEVGLHFGAHPELGIEVAIGYHRSTVTAPYYGPMATTIEFVPVLLGLTSTPALIRSKHVELRLDLGADVADFFRLGCKDCDAAALGSDAFVGILRAGLDTYFMDDQSVGIGVAAVYLSGSQGNLNDPVAPSPIEIRVPTFLVRVSLVARKHDKVAW